MHFGLLFGVSGGEGGVGVCGVVGGEGGVVGVGGGTGYKRDGADETSEGGISCCVLALLALRALWRWPGDVCTLKPRQLAQ